MPHGSVALTGGTGKAAVSVSTVAAGGPAYAAAWQGESKGPLSRWIAIRAKALSQLLHHRILALDVN